MDVKNQKRVLTEFSRAAGTIKFKTALDPKFKDTAEGYVSRASAAHVNSLGTALLVQIFICGAVRTLGTFYLSDGDIAARYADLCSLHFERYRKRDREPKFNYSRANAVQDFKSEPHFADLLRRIETALILAKILPDLDLPGSEIPEKRRSSKVQLERLFTKLDSVLARLESLERANLRIEEGNARIEQRLNLLGNPVFVQPVIVEPVTPQPITPGPFPGVTYCENNSGCGNSTPVLS